METYTHNTHKRTPTHARTLNTIRAKYLCLETLVVMKWVAHANYSFTA